MKAKQVNIYYTAKLISLSQCVSVALFGAKCLDKSTRLKPDHITVKSNFTLFKIRLTGH